MARGTHKGLSSTKVRANNNDESLKAYLAPAGLVSEPQGDPTCRGVEEPWKYYMSLSV